MIAQLVAVSLAGGIGAALRFVVDGAVRGRAPASFPYGTLIVNLSGSLVLGLLAGLTLGRVLPPEWQLVVGTGLLGGYTTFSTASVETVRLVEERRWAAALMNGLGMLLGCVLAAWVGYLIGAAGWW